MSGHHSLKTKRRAIELYEQGYSSRGIGKELGVAARQISRWLARYRSQGDAGLQKQSYMQPTAAFKR